MNIFINLPAESEDPDRTALQSYLGLRCSHTRKLPVSTIKITTNKFN